MPNQLATIEQAQSTLIDLSIKFGTKIVIAILILAGGFYAGRWIGTVFDRWLGKNHLEPPVQLLPVRIVRLMIPLPAPGRIPFYRRTQL